MGYYQNNYQRIRDEYATKALNAERDADLIRSMIYEKLPELKTLEKELSRTGLEVMEIAMNQSKENVLIAIEGLKAKNLELQNKRKELLIHNGYTPEMLEPKYECKLCNDSGFIGVKMCSCMKKKLVEANMQSCGLGHLLKEQSFDNFSMEYYSGVGRTKMQCNLERAKQFTNHIRDEHGCNLLLLGGTGLGKTHISTSIAKEALENGFDVFYTTSVGMLSDFEAKRFGNGTMGGDGDNTAKYLECDVLILDDLGTEVINQFTISNLYYVISTRLNNAKSTIVNTNFMPDDIRKYYGDRIYSRLMGEYMPLPFEGVDIRQQKIMKGMH